MTEEIALSDVVLIVGLIGSIGALWMTIIKTIRTEIARIEIFIKENKEEIKEVRKQQASSSQAFSRDFVTKADLKERLAWNGDNRRDT